MTIPRVLAYPQSHPYVDRLDGTAARLVRPDSDAPRLPLAYDPDWVATHADGWDLAHLHFGHEQHPLDQVVEVVRAHRRAGRPVVVTAHDLQVPHLPAGDTAALDLLDAIAPCASAVTTLTEGCADVLRRRLGADVEVLPHGPLVPALIRQRARAAHRGDGRPSGHVLVHAGRVRPNAGLAEVVAAAAALDRPGAVRIGVREEDAAAVRSLAAGVPAVEVLAGPRLPEADLVRAVAAADALLLPYRWGTHSGLLELAADVGTPVRCTAAGFVAEQRDAALRHAGDPPAPVHVAADPAGGADAPRIDVAALRQAITAAPRPGERARSAARAQDDRAFLEGHARLYRRVLVEGGVAA